MFGKCWSSGYILAAILSWMWKYLYLIDNITSTARLSEMVILHYQYKAYEWTRQTIFFANYRTSLVICFLLCYYYGGLNNLVTHTCWINQMVFGFIRKHSCVYIELKDYRWFDIEILVFTSNQLCACILHCVMLLLH